MRTKIIVLVLFLTSNIAFTQSINITVNNLEPSVANFFYLEGEKTFLLDSIISNVDNKFILDSAKYKLHTGFYRVALGKNNKWIDFIYDGENVKLKTDINNILDSLTVIISESNRIYYSFIKLNKDYKTKTELLQLILTRYPKDDDYYINTQKKLTEIQKKYLEFVNHISQNVPNSFISRYIKSAQLPVIEGTLLIEEQLDYLKKHSLDNVAFN